MSKAKTSPRIRKLVLQAKRKNSHLGVRAIAGLILDKDKIKLSKSTVSNILKSQGCSGPPGRKKALKLYQTKEFKHCGLLLLRALDSKIGLFDYLAKELRVYLPWTKKKLLKKLIILASFSSLVNKNLKDSSKEPGFLRLAGLKSLSQKQIDYFNQRISQYKPQVALKPVKDNLGLIFSIKFYFNNGEVGYSDARLATFWNKPCKHKPFSLNLGQALKRLEAMFEQKSIIIGYTKSFDYFSPAVLNFITGLKSGLKKCEFLDDNSKVIKSLGINLSNISLSFGYNPKLLFRGIVLASGSKRLKSLIWPQIGEFFFSKSLARVILAQGKKELHLTNILLKKSLISLDSWAIITTRSDLNRPENLTNFIKKYLYLWPGTWKGFLKDIKAIEDSLNSAKVPKNKDYLGQILPKRLIFRQIEDFSFLGQILSVIFKELIAGWEPKSKAGYFIQGKDYLQIQLKNMPLAAKNSFNQAGLQIEEKRVFVA